MGNHSLQFNCYFSSLTSAGEWIDHQGKNHTFFSGNSGENICECGRQMPNKCHKIANTINNCNCDARDPVERQDLGYITNKVLGNGLL